MLEIMSHGTVNLMGCVCCSSGPHCMGLAGLGGGVLRILSFKKKIQSNIYIHIYCALHRYDDEFLLAEYFGETFEGIPHGRGYKVFSTGASYMGDWVHGLETTTKPGTFGIFEWPDGTKYEGTFMRGRRHGRGTKTLPLQRGSYEGEFANGIEHGLGIKRYADGSSYEGRFRYGVRDGSGCMHNIDGTKQKGVFRDPPLGADALSDSAFTDPPRAALSDYETPDLLSLCTKRLAQVVKNQWEGGYMSPMSVVIYEI
jgi:hypothetical protein